MNFSFMIILIFVLLIYIKLKLNIETYIILGLLILLLGINELYNYSEYSKDNFKSENDETKENEIYRRLFKFNKNLNPYDYSNSIFKSYIIPNQYINTDGTIDNKLSLGLTCKGQKNMVNYNLQKKKLQDQNKYTNDLLNFFNCQGPNKHKCTPIKRNNLDDSVYNIIETPTDQNIKKCPNVCFDITSKDKCINQTYYPIMRDETDYKEKLEPELIECESKSPYKYASDPDPNKYSGYKGWCEKEWNYDKGNFKVPISDRKCKLDESEEICEYDKRACIYIGKHDKGDIKIDGEPKCFKRCEFFNDETNIDKSQIDCENAVFNNGDKGYCNWDKGSSQCKSKCYLYYTGTGTERTCTDKDCILTCNSDKYCHHDDETDECVNI